MSSVTPEPPPLPPFPTTTLNFLSHKRQQPATMFPSQNNYVNSNNLVITPTTAGLPNFNCKQQKEQLQQQSNSLGSPLSSQVFKNELLARQSKFSEAESSMSIDDRIKNSRRNNMMANQGKTDNVLSKCHLSPDEQQAANMPNKLLSTLQRERRPFAYSPDVNDPNNRGKLDLSQIKSPTMRRRLLANLESSSAEENDDDYDGDDNLERKSSIEVDCRVQHGCSSQQQTISGFSHPPRIAQYSAPKIHYQAAPNDANRSHQKSQNKIFATSTSKPVLVHHNEPPEIFNFSRESSSALGSKRDQMCPITHYGPEQHRFQESGRRYMDDLGTEVTNSLDSLSSMISNMDIKAGTDARKDYSSKCTTFLPQRVKKSTESNKNPSQPIVPNCNPNQRSTRGIATPLNNNGSMGDCLLSPETSFLSDGTNSSPYTVLPYYGSSLDANSYSSPHVASSNRSYGSKNFQSSCITFAAPPTVRATGFRDDEIEIINRQQQPARLINRYAAAENMTSGCQIVNPANNFNQIQALRDMTVRLESEVERLYHLRFK